MKNSIILVIFLFLSTYSYSQSARTTPLIIDHNSSDKFSQIPDSVLGDIIKLKLMFRHASVGTTVDNGLDCIQGSRTNPAVCKTFPAYKYDRRNWDFQGRGNSGWYGKITDFVNEVNLQNDSFDIFSFKYCYLDGLDQVAEPCGGANFKPSLVAKAWDSLKTNFERLETKYPDKVFVMWTIPLTQPGMHCTDTLNYLMRDYVVKNNKILFDIADIQSWDTLNKHLISPEGWEMAFSGYCGEKPPGPSCHPNWTGSVILAKAFWWMMANIAGEITIVPDTTPDLSTTEVTAITQNSAVGGGNILYDGSKPIILRGVVWSTSTTPTVVLGTKTSDGSGSGTFVSNMTGLSANTTYYVRAYATNSDGTFYGNELSFKTDLISINENELKSVNVYPNPSKGVFFVNVPATCTEIHIINTSAELVKVLKADGAKEFDFNMAEKGIYLIKIFTETQVIIKKLVVL